jgi:FkbM family methyltransferase
MGTNESAGEPLKINVRGGSRICVPRDLDQAATYVLLEQEDWFEDEIRFLRHWLKPGMQAVDVGANYGVYTAAMAQSVGPGGRVWSFEPTPSAANLLQQTLALNGFAHVELSSAAVSDHVGTVEFEIGPDSELNKIAGAGSPVGEVLKVPAITLSQIASTQDWSGVDFIKIDVEEHEPQVVAGGAGFFSRHSPLVMLEVLSNGRFEARALGQLKEMGYEVFRLIPGLMVLAPLDHDELDSFHLNLFACKQPFAERLAAEGCLSPVDAAASSKPDNKAWGRFLESAPYARELAGRWPEKAGFFSARGASIYYDGLASFAQSRDTEQSASERLAWLRRAFDRVCRAIEQHDTLPRTISYARLAWELGLREAATHGLRQAANKIREEAGRAEREPFLAPSLRYEALPADTAPHDWLECSVLEQLEKVRAFSSLYGGAATLSVLEPVFRRPFRSPESERRRQLVRMRTGIQSEPETHPLLCRASEENLNPAYWCPGKRP